MFVDDDIDAPPGWLAAYLEGAERHPGADAFGGPIRARFEGRAPRSCGREPAPITTLDLGPEDRDADSSGGRTWRSAAARSTGSGPSTRSCRQFGEEEEWLTRLRDAGGRVVYLADAQLDHRREAGDAGLGVLMRGAYLRGRRLRLTTCAGARRPRSRTRCASSPAAAGTPPAMRARRGS